MFIEALVKPNKLREEEKIFFKWYNSNLNKIKKKVILNKINTNQLDPEQYSINLDRNSLITSRDFFSIFAIQCKNTISREVKSGWSQPILKEKFNPSGLIVLFRKEINNIPYYLVNCKFEPGNISLVHVSPTIQVTYSNITFNKKYSKNYYLSIFNRHCKKRSLIDTLVSEDGGRFFKKQNRNIILDCNNIKIKVLNDSFKWISFFLLKKINQKSKIINPHIRSIFSLI